MVGGERKSNWMAAAKCRRWSSGQRKMSGCAARRPLGVPLRLGSVWRAVMAGGRGGTGRTGGRRSGRKNARSAQAVAESNDRRSTRLDAHDEIEWLWCWHIPVEAVGRQRHHSCLHGRLQQKWRPVVCLNALDSHHYTSSNVQVKLEQGI